MQIAMFTKRSELILKMNEKAALT